MNNISKTRLKEIHDEVSELTYSEDNFLEIINYIEEAIRIAKNDNRDKRANSFLNNLRQTKEKQLAIMKANYKIVEDRESNFNALYENFLIDLLICD